jgi:hypothetical protein
VDAKGTIAVAIASALAMGTGSVAIASVVNVTITPDPVTARIVTETRPYTVTSPSTVRVVPGVAPPSPHH